MTPGYRVIGHTQSTAPQHYSFYVVVSLQKTTPVSSPQQYISAVPSPASGRAPYNQGGQVLIRPTQHPMNKPQPRSPYSRKNLNSSSSQLYEAWIGLSTRLFLIQPMKNL